MPGATTSGARLSSERSAGSGVAGVAVGGGVAVVAVRSVGQRVVEAAATGRAAGRRARRGLAALEREALEAAEHAAAGLDTIADVAIIAVGVGRAGDENALADTGEALILDGVFTSVVAGGAVGHGLARAAAIALAPVAGAGVRVVARGPRADGSRHRHAPHVAAGFDPRAEIGDVEDVAPDLAPLERREPHRRIALEGERQ